VRSLSIFLTIAAGIFLIDQGVKELFLQGYEWQSRCISLELHLNRGVAFSMFAFLGEYLKWIQVLLVSALTYYLFSQRVVAEHPLLSGTLFGAAVGNLYDRFSEGAVVDYFYWHCGFDFAVFNFADVMIDLAVAGFAIIYIFLERNEA
jgi:signal peptidase II